MKDRIKTVQFQDNSIINPADCTFMDYVPGEGLWYRLDPAKQHIDIEETDIFVPFTSLKRISLTKGTFIP